MEIKIHNIEIRRPKVEDSEELNKFFNIVIKDTFIKEGLGNLTSQIENEIELKKDYLKSDLSSNGENRYFLIAVKDNKIVGTIEYGIANEVIKKQTNGALNDLVEVGTVFVRPEFQRQGIGKLLLSNMFITLKNKGINTCCLDSGYTHAQKIWKRKFGEPSYLLKDFWGVGYDHMIWIINL